MLLGQKEIGKGAKGGHEEGEILHLSPDRSFNTGGGGVLTKQTARYSAGSLLALTYSPPGELYRVVLVLEGESRDAMQINSCYAAVHFVLSCTHTHAQPHTHMHTL